ncbi:unnamed protein product [Meloidogyne enterolobii]|uniref:Uncharacterized protein n=1 Tax=Meloidogyne enterolobii TaxID=390850 RepID=A0ACB0YL07_MELEN
MWEGKMGRGGKEESMFSRSEDTKCCMGERMKWWQKKRNWLRASLLKFLL